MKKVFIVIMVLVLLLGLGITLAYAEAQQVDLIDSNNEVSGWVIANKNESGEIILEIHVKKVEEGTLFYVFIEDDFWIWKGDAFRDGEFITNKVGNGNFHATIPSTNVTEIKTVVVREPFDAWKAGGGRYYTAKMEF